MCTGAVLLVMITILMNTIIVTGDVVTGALETTDETIGEEVVVVALREGDDLL